MVRRLRTKQIDVNVIVDKELVKSQLMLVHCLFQRWMKHESICFVSPKRGDGKLIGCTYLLLGYACMPFVLLFFSLI